ncbi:lantibiotic dehydratase C-terminal domain-containing protein [Plantactinospora sp. KLBMP9567]|uniref:lantibiotic dehydratase C-terminal domain-containing protein n=1 Tax=Plantactinospora sp. KLBMP9567 TaxID=3085900 RepID=UPI0029823C9D|nr:lantibiotic dehydratase C-terminal domain-containing protein [Plantactinospora sp. KLBMP9567]MDW5326591.1 lantibiotic dehydratase C-terminal domain-containing protein [Plantactinospora sp. KLBMP9567]
MPETEPAAAGEALAAEPGRWLAIHIFYGGSARPMLTECIRPLVDELRAQNLLARYFFINYWLEGPHVRLRLKLRTAADEPAVRAAADAAIQRFLTERPALYELDAGYRAELYNLLFDLEFPQGKPAELVGPDGNVRMQPNNSFSYRPYEPEYGKYGGPAGIALAEWHFEYSSDVLIDAVRTMNLHLRPVTLGTAAQLMLVTAGTFLPDRAELAEFLDTYHDFWHRAFAGTDFVNGIDYATMYERLAPDLDRRFQPILGALDRGEQHRLPAFLRGWAEHAAQLRERARRLAESGQLTFAFPEGTPAVTVTDPRVALPRLLSPYLHMTNNRLYVTLRDEAYLAYLLGRAVRDSLAAR